MLREPETDKRQQILTAAARVFAARGFHRAKMADIALEAGVGKGTIYEYFPSKKELFRQMVIHLFTTYVGYLQGMCQQDLSLPGFLEKLLRNTINFLQQHRHFAQILLTDHPLLGEDMMRFFWEIKKQNIRHLSEYISRKIEGKEMRPLNPWLAATIVLHVLGALGYYFLQERGSEEVEVAGEVEGMVSAVKDILLYGFSRA